ncbi:MAG TPA: GDSL-type esterase/lipase family protein [Verrucomicrobiota bacterium]|nr:GDSL-type esterase/lipase family protein [Verrucomicrobiota bacterium]
MNIFKSNIIKAAILPLVIGVILAGSQISHSQDAVITESLWPANDEFGGKGALQKADWFKKLWQQRRSQWKKDAAKDQGAIVFAGDSITQGWNLEKYFPNLKVANRGISGDTTIQLRYRFKEDVISLKPTAIVLLIGTNDLGLGGTPEEAAENIGAILNQIKSDLPKTPVIVCKVMPRQPQFAEKIKRLNALVDKLVEGNPQFIRCDTYSIYADEKGAAKKEEFPDMLHPNSAGYQKWKAALEPIFAKIVKN